MSFPKYPAYKNSNIKWCGDIPQHWKIARGKSIFHLQRRQPEDNSEIITAFRDGQVTKRKNRREDGFTNSVKEIGYQGVCENDLVIHAMDAFAGAIGVSDANGKCSPVYSCCTPLEGISQFYYEKLLRYMAMSGYISSLSKGVRERSTEFRWNDFSTQLYPLPPLPEQQAIASFLDRECGKIDALIAEQERLIALLKEKRQAVISHAVTKGLNPNAPMKDSGVEWIGEIPVGWGIQPLKRLFSLKNGATPKSGKSDFWDGEITWITPADLNSERPDIITNSKRYISAKGAESCAVSIVPEDSIIISTRAPIGSLGLSGVPLCTNQGCRSLIPTKGVLSSFFLYLLYSAVPELQILGQGTTFLELSSESLASFHVCFPPLPEQQAIASFLDRECGKIDSLVEEQKSMLAFCKERRAALISAAVTGKIDVRAQSKAIAA